MVFHAWFLSLRITFLSFIQVRKPMEMRGRQTEASHLQTEKDLPGPLTKLSPPHGTSQPWWWWFTPQEQPMPFPSSLPHPTLPHHLSCPKAVAMRLAGTIELRGLESVPRPCFLLSRWLGQVIELLWVFFFLNCKMRDKNDSNSFLPSIHKLEVCS